MLNTSDFSVQEVIEERETVAREILENLPQWFGIEEARERYVNEAEKLPMHAAFRGSQALGFLTIKEHSTIHCEITVMGVLPAAHRRGIGRTLIEAAATDVKNRGRYLLSVKTLAERSNDPHYAKTIAFYRGVGFHDFEEFPTLWSDTNPCAMLIMDLRTPIDDTN